MLSKKKLLWICVCAIAVVAVAAGLLGYYVVGPGQRTASTVCVNSESGNAQAEFDIAVRKALLGEELKRVEFKKNMTLDGAISKIEGSRKNGYTYEVEPAGDIYFIGQYKDGAFVGGYYLRQAEENYFVLAASESLVRQKTAFDK